MFLEFSVDFFIDSARSLTKKNAKNAKNRGSFLPPPVPPLNKGTREGPKITEHSTERSAEQGMFGLSLVLTMISEKPVFGNN